MSLGAAYFFLNAAWGEAQKTSTRRSSSSLGLLVVSGAALALLHFTSPVEMLTTAYGVSLAIKLPPVAIALFFAWRARHRWELATLLVVIAAASVVVSLPPPR